MAHLFTLRDYYPSSACVSPPLLAAQFTKANSEYLSLTSNATVVYGDDDFSFAGWFYTDTATDYMHILSKGLVYAAGGEYALYTGNTNPFNLRWEVRDASDSSSQKEETGNTLSPGAWHSFCCTHDKTNNRIGLSLDGGNFTYQAVAAGLNSSTNDLLIGARSNGVRMDGRIMCVGMWRDRVLSNADAATWHNSGSPLAYCALPSGLLTSLSSFWELSEESGTRADSHGSNDLTDNNTVTSVAWNS